MPHAAQSGMWIPLTKVPRRGLQQRLPAPNPSKNGTDGPKRAVGSYCPNGKRNYSIGSQYSVACCGLPELSTGAWPQTHRKMSLPPVPALKLV